MSLFFKVAGLSAALVACAWAQSLKLPSVFSDNAVLQAGAPVPVFGKAKPGATVKVSFVKDYKDVAAGAETVADKDGKWLAMLPVLAEGISGELRVETTGEEPVSCFNALAGEVWLCSGQSNMAFQLNAPTMPAAARVVYRKEAALANGQIRQFMVKRLTSPTPNEDVEGVWIALSPENAGQCTAVGWNFAWRIFKETGAPVGLIHSSWGGTPVEAWLSEEAIASSQAGTAVRERHEKMFGDAKPTEAAYQKGMAEFNAKYKTNPERIAHRAEMPRFPYSLNFSNQPSRLYNAMIRGLEPYGIRGVLWYQGEANAGRPTEYGHLMQALVNSWRKAFNNDQAAFYYVELANFMQEQQRPVEGAGWGLIREAQASVLELPLTGVGTAVDVGEAKDIHPTDKKTVGERLAGMALTDIYGKKGLSRSPQYTDHKVVGDKVFVKLDYADGLRARGGEIKGFAIRSEGGEWVWAENVKILPDGVVEVASAEVKQPAAVRYGWASNPVISLENEAGLPLRPFRTDKNTDQ